MLRLSLLSPHLCAVQIAAGGKGSKRRILVCADAGRLERHGEVGSRVGEEHRSRSFDRSSRQSGS